jgi:hypothetical protein
MSFFDAFKNNKKAWKVDTRGEFHYPGTNYLGPGTNIRDRIILGIAPTTNVDRAALQHDIDYTNSDNAADLILADAKAIQTVLQSETSLQQLAMILGLTLRSTASINTGLAPLFGGKPDKELAKLLQQIYDGN